MISPQVVLNRITTKLRGDWLQIAILAAVLFIVFPLLLDAFRLNLMGKYLTLAFVAVGLVMCWGYGGILSL